MKQFFGKHKLWCINPIQPWHHFTDQNISLFSKAVLERNITPILSDTDRNSSYQKLQKLYMNKLKNFFPLAIIFSKQIINGLMIIFTSY